jgi:hypothetical protein
MPTQTKPELMEKKARRNALKRLSSFFEKQQGFKEMR